MTRCEPYVTRYDDDGGLVLRCATHDTVTAVRNELGRRTYNINLPEMTALVEAHRREHR